MRELEKYYLHAQVQIPDTHGSTSGYPVGAFQRGMQGVIRILEDNGVVLVEREAQPTLVIVGLNVGTLTEKAKKQ